MQIAFYNGNIVIWFATQYWILRALSLNLAKAEEQQTALFWSSEDCTMEAQNDTGVKNMYELRFI